MTLNLVDFESQGTGLVPRDGFDRPLVVPKGGGKAVAHTRTTTFIDCIEDKSALTDYAQRNVLIGAAKDESPASLLLEVRGLDPEDPDDKRRLNEIVERLVVQSGANEKRDRGTRYHTLSEHVDRGEQLPDDVTDVELADMGAYKMATVFMDMRHIEELIVCNALSVAGTPDRIGDYEGPGPDGKPFSDTVIIDLKTGNLDYGLVKMAAQLGIYSRGEFYNHKVFPAVDTTDKAALAKWKQVEHDAALAATAYTPIPPVNQDWGIIIGLTPGSGECNLHWVNLHEGYKRAELAQTIRAGRARKGLMISFAKVQENVEKARIKAEKVAAKAELTSSASVCKLDNDKQGEREENEPSE